MVSTAIDLRECQRVLASSHVKPDDRTASMQVLTTLLPLAGLWVCVAHPSVTSAWLLAGMTALMSLFLVRIFVLMHDCGHGSLFRTPAINKGVGFAFGVLSGIPQQVWSQHHLYHHANNGNWARFRGPLNIIPSTQYAALTKAQQHRYRLGRNAWLAPFGGFVYLILNPRLNWLRASVGLARHLIAGKIATPAASLTLLAGGYSAPYCSSFQAYRFMSWNNIALLGLWGVMAWAVGPGVFFPLHLVSLSLAGGAAIVLFTVQHNFERSYASGDEGWDSNAAVLHGTSFLLLPPWANWFTANIAYHHIHHLCAGIPNYRLARCHDEQAHLFSDVTRIRFSQIPRSLKCILWDAHSRQVISVQEHQRQVAVAPVAHEQ